MKQGLQEEIMSYIRTNVRDGKNTQAFKYESQDSFLM